MGLHEGYGMNLLAYWRSVSEKFFHRNAVAEEMEEEVRAHIALRADDLDIYSGWLRA